MEKLVRRFTARTILAFGFSVFSIFALTTVALSFSLDQYGTGALPCSYQKCSVTKATPKSNTPEKSTYEFEGACTTTQEGCKNTNMIAFGEWNKKTKIATEKIGRPISGSSSYIEMIETKSSCSDNPWINKNASCTPISQSTQTIPGPFPQTARLMTDSQRQAFQAFNPKAEMIETPKAPVIQSPTPNQAFFAPAKIPLKVQHNPNYGVIFQFERIPLTKTKTPYVWATRKVTPDNLKTNAGVTTGELNIDETGKWRFRAMCNFPGAPWSDWRDFVVNEQLGLVGKVDVIGLEASPAAPSNLVATPLPQRKVKLEWQDKSNNEDKFIIERKDPGKTYQKKAEVGKDVKTWTDEDKLLLLNQTYYYRVKANNKYGDSPSYSNEANAKIKLN